MLWSARYLLFAMSFSVWSADSRSTQVEDEEAFSLSTDNLSLFHQVHAFNPGDQLDVFALNLERAKREGRLAERDDQGMTIAHHAVCKGVRSEILDLVLASGAPFNLQDRLGRTPLHCLVERFFKCSSFDLCRMPPHYKKILEVMTKVRKIEVPLDVRDVQGRLPLDVILPKYSHGSIVHAFVRAEKIDELREIAALGLPVVFTAEDGRSTLDDALSVNMVMFLQSQGGNIFERRQNGFTMLHNTHSGLVAQFLINSGLKINDAQNEKGLTPLHNAVICRWIDVVRVLLENDVSAGDEEVDDSSLERKHESMSKRRRV